MTFEELSARRRSYVDSARANGFEEGLRNLLSELYPDNAHFIYELLQNAEDAGAREVIFDLRSEGLQVEHDGKRLFDLRDIESITGIGQSTKKDDATTIGKFGVGFKAVFAYTETPVIHSGEHAFVIQDLFVPTQVAAAARSERTTFWFPFNRADKPTARAVDEVANALCDLLPTTLLFLNNIQLIACSLPDGDELLIERVALDEHIIKIESTDDEGSASYWYRISGDVDVDGRSFPAAAAFELEASGVQPKGLTGFSVKPADGQVFIYFPAVKETSGLRFHIHAPFASTVARDSVRDDPGNDALIDGISELIVEALPAMRDAGLITDGLLKALPNKSDVLPDRYDVVRDRIAEAFENDELTPLAGGGHAPSVQLFRGESSLRAALAIGDANFLQRFSAYDTDPRLGWIRSAEGRAGAFLNALSATDFTVMHLAGLLAQTTADAGARKRWDEWLAAKPDDWLRGLYSALGGLAQRNSPFLLHHAWKSVPFIRVQYGGGTTHVAGHSAYMPTARGLCGDWLVIDALAVFDDEWDAGDDRARKALREFYDSAGVRPWDAAAQLDARLGLYSQHPPVITDGHLADLVALNLLIQRNAVTPGAYADRPIFVAVQPDGTRRWAAAREIYLDDPFVTTGLGALYHHPAYQGNPLLRLAPEYAGESFDIATLAKTLEATVGLVIKRVPVWGNQRFDKQWRWDGKETQYMVSRDWVIPHFDAVVATEDEVLVRSLWHLVSSADGDYADAAYRSNASTRSHIIESQLLQALQSTPWILDRDGNLRYPDDVTADDLAEGLSMPPKAPLLERAGFGRKAAANLQRQREDEDAARTLGFESPAEVRRLAELRKQNPEKFSAFMEDLEAAVRLPDGVTVSPEGRARRARQSSADAPVRRYENRVRSVYVAEPGHLSASRGYLRQHYTNGDGVMVCQACSSAMPFKLSGEYYFEAVQFVTDTERDLRENRLAMCPTCAAKYRHARGTSVEDLRDDLLTQDVGSRGSITVDVVLAGVSGRLRFVGKHAIDLQAALKASEGYRTASDEYENSDMGSDGWL
ncbi:hypothetical protein NLX85_18375 [Micromonospora sp. A3M-1-15]|uniref:sacsin N-terminal ATP-binding-like domain-containing protein n=1 Tax=Micromonospora sp. A3M-1-15 TaxID=2962035 RepID=UPI0020B8F27F|nr:hypothetical protein [Micromonospora sp. A3M-1-15]MCP3785330.1 hypothetical protein [Micromonospora sp. A3M-1-15]